MTIKNTPEGHYVWAEFYLEQAKDLDWDNEEDASLASLSVQVAQVHATLATAPDFDFYKNSGIVHKVNATTTDKHIAPNAGLEHIGEDFV